MLLNELNLHCHECWPIACVMHGPVPPWVKVKTLSKNYQALAERFEAARVGLAMFLGAPMDWDMETLLEEVALRERGYTHHNPGWVSTMCYCGNNTRLKDGCFVPHIDQHTGEPCRRQWAHLIGEVRTSEDT